MTFLAVGNINHVSLLVNFRSIVAFVILIGVLVYLMYRIEVTSKRKMGNLYLVALCVVIIGAVEIVHQHQKWLSKNILDLRDGYYSNRDNRLIHKSPIESLYKVFFREKKRGLKVLTNEDIEKANTYGVAINPNQQFPLVKDYIYRGSVPYNGDKDIETKPNVIVFFAEDIVGKYIDQNPLRDDALSRL